MGSAASGRNAAKSVASSSARSAVDHRQPHMAVRRGAAVPGQVLEDRQHAALHEPGRDRRRDRRHLLGRVAVGAIPDHRVGAGDRDVRHRQAIHIDAEREQITGDQARPEPRGFEARRPVVVVEPSVVGTRRIARPMRRPEPLHAAALLIDQHRRIGPADRRAELSDQPANLLGRRDVALEDDQPPGRSLTQERTFRRRDVACRRDR